jgi:hypothetical protein
LCCCIHGDFLTGIVRVVRGKLGATQTITLLT